MIRFISTYDTISANVGDNFEHPRPQEVNEVQAERPEATAIYEQISGIPTVIVTKWKPGRWFGDHAKFIAANVKF